MKLSDATALKVGSRAVTAAYLGTRPVWSGGGTPTLDVAEVRSILDTLNAAVWIPGPDGADRHGYTVRNYVESEAAVLTAAGGVVGFVRDSRSALVSTLMNATFSSTTDGFAPISASATTAVTGGVLRVTSVSGSTTGAQRIFSTTAGKTYEITGRIRRGTATTGMIRVCNTDFLGATLAESANVTAASFEDIRRVFTATSSTTAIYLRVVATASGQYAEYDDIVLTEISGVHASQATTQYKPTLVAVGSTYCWRFDADDALTATFPTGWESSTIIAARATGYVTQTAQNIVGARTITGAGDLYGRIYIPSTPAGDQLTKIQAFANLLAGV